MVIVRFVGIGGIVDNHSFKNIFIEFDNGFW